MAAPNTRNAAAAKPGIGGGVYRAPLGTVLPTDADTTLAPAFVSLGYISDAGIVPTRETNVDKPKAWGGDIVAQLLTDESSSFAFTLLEVFAAETQKFVHGAANVTVTEATPATTGTTPTPAKPTKIAVVDKGGKPEQQVLVFEMKHGNKRRRVIVPVADPVIDGEEPWTDNNLSAYSVMVEAIKDASGARAYSYFVNDDAAA